MEITKIKQVYKGSKLIDLPENVTIYYDNTSNKITLHKIKEHTELDHKYSDDCKIWDKIENKETFIDVSELFS